MTALRRFWYQHILGYRRFLVFYPERIDAVVGKGEPPKFPGEVSRTETWVSYGSAAMGEDPKKGATR